MNHSTESVLDALAEAYIVAVIRAPSAPIAIRAVEALLAGGITAIELTYSTPDAADVIATLVDRHTDRALVGAGTVRTADQARDAADAGALFLVAPGTESGLLTSMLATGRTVISGALTPSEVMSVSAGGAHAVKLFPASLGGPEYLRALRAPFPDLSFIPTGGVSPNTLAHWMDAGAVAVGAGSELCSAADLGNERYETIASNARVFSAALEGLRRS